MTAKFNFKPTMLHTPNGRLGLPVQSKPWKKSIGYGLTLGYRRTKRGAGSWIAIVADGKGGQNEHWLGFSDDAQAASHERPLLDRKEAEAAAEAYAEARAASNGPVKDPPTIEAALTAFKNDLRSRRKNPDNAQMPRFHLKDGEKDHPLLAQRTDQVQSGQLKEWRDGLIAGGMEPSTCNRIVKPLVAALNLVAKHDKRVRANAEAWKLGLEMLEDATVARNALLPKSQVYAVVAEAYNVSPEFGLFVQMHAETGGRPSQLRKLTVADFKADRVMMPPHNKGKGKRKRNPTSVPVQGALAERLADAVGDRPANAPLLLREDGLAWEAADQRYRFERARKAAKLPVGATLYWLRHNSIAHALMDGAPVWIVATWHTTSVDEIRDHYGSHIKEHHDDVIRKFQLNTAPGDNIVPFPACL